MSHFSKLCGKRPGLSLSIYCCTESLLDCVSYGYFCFRYGGGSKFGDRGGGASRFGGGGGGFGGGMRGGPKPSMKGSQPGERLRKPRWDMSRLAKFEKNFYVEHPNVVARTDTETEQFRREGNIQVKGSIVPKPVITFEEAGFPGKISACAFQCLYISKL